MQNGKIGVTTENIFPIIKKFLYSDHEIFLRELVSNAVDATQKIKTLSSIGEFKGELGELQITIELYKEARRLTISDNGVGMSAEEVDKYINQIAFSGAEEFMEKYKNQAIIGHFGLGFYSSFMVADRVEIRTQSHDEQKPTMIWSCEGSPEYTLTESSEKRGRGTDIILYISEESAEFADKQRISDLLNKYCRFLPVPIVFGKKQTWKEGKNVDTEEDNLINDTSPLWMRKPSEIEEAEYNEFYRKLYPSGDDPMFHIHLNIDYPFNLTGILYFPKIRNNFEIQKNKIQLYSNQVYVTDSVEGIVPEFLTLLHGVIDSPDIPLNVSRSYLQSDGNVKKISSYITRKVGDRLQELFNASRDEFEKKWDSLKIFIEYGVITEEKFAEKAQNFMLLKNTDDKYFTLEEYGKLVGENQTDKNGDVIYLYTNDVETKYSFVEAAKAKGYDVLVMDGQLDNHFINWFESKNPKSRFVRVDSNVVEKLIHKAAHLTMSLSSLQQAIMQPVFESQLPDELDKGAHYSVVFEALDAKDAPVMITQNEQMRRMKDMAAMGGGDGMAQFYAQMPDSYTIAINGNHPLVIDVLDDVEKAYGDKLEKVNKKIDAAKVEQDSIKELLKEKKKEELSTEERAQSDAINERVGKLTEERNVKLREIGGQNFKVKQLIDLALLSNGMLKGEKLSAFISRSVELMSE